MSCAGSHWGEELDSQRGASDDWSLSSADMDDLLTPMPPHPTTPMLHQPSHEETPSFQTLPAEFCRTDPLVLQTIKHLQYQRQVYQLIGRSQANVMDVGSLPACAPPPEEPVLDRKTTKPHFLNYIPPERTPFTSGKNNPQLLEVDGTIARQILRRSVATVCAHTGYTDTSESVLRLLTDVTHDFMGKLTSVLRANTDNLLLTDRCPFHDVVEQTLHDVGLGSMTELHKMYRERVLQYHARVRQDSVQLFNQYSALVLAREANAPTPGSSRRESTGDWWLEESSSQHMGLTGVSGPGLDDASVPSIKSTSSLDPELSLHPYSVLSQTGADGEDVVQNSPVTTQQYQIYPLTPR